jgi:hypothetical protein
VPASGQQITLATNVDAQFAIDPNGVAVVMANASGLVASAPSGVGGLVSIYTGVESWVVSSDGRSVVYATTTNALKRASTSAPVSPTELVASSFQGVDVLSPDGSWALGYLTQGGQSGTSDLYAASAISSGAPFTLSSAATAASGLAGDSFTTDSKYAVFLTDVTSTFTGTLMAYALGTAGAPTVLAPNTFEDLAVVGSQLVYNSNDANGKADIAWVDLAKGTTPTAIVTQADEEFLLGPARDKVVYTYAAGGTSDGLWIAPLPGTPGGAPITCTPVGAMSFHPVAGGSGSCTPAQVSLYDDDCISTLTASSTSCLNAASDVGTTCFDCLDTPVTSTSWGVVLENAAAGIDQLNTGGCFEKQGSTACAQASELQLECENNACVAQTNKTGYDACVATADTSTCACYVTNVSTLCGPVASSACAFGPSATFESQFLAYAQIMCE